jgi:hypothetical protein
MLDNFFEEWYRITKLKISNFFEWFFHKLRGKEVMNWAIVKSAGGNYLWLPAPITIIFKKEVGL